MQLKHYFLIVLVLLALAVIPLASASDPPKIIVANCGTGSTSLTANVTMVITGSSGAVMFNCGSAGEAITVTRTGAATPIFQLPTPYTTLTISSSPSCASAFTLISGRVLKFGARAGEAPVTGYNYCATFSNAPATGLVSFSVTWFPHHHHA